MKANGPNRQSPNGIRKILAEYEAVQAASRKRTKTAQVAKTAAPA